MYFVVVIAVCLYGFVCLFVFCSFGFHAVVFLFAFHFALFVCSCCCFVCSCLFLLVGLLFFSLSLAVSPACVRFPFESTWSLRELPTLPVALRLTNGQVWYRSWDDCYAGKPRLHNTA